MEKDAPAGFSMQSRLDQDRPETDLIPMCAHCKKIRTHSGDWIRVENHPKQSPHLQVTHTICPDCAKILYPQYKIYES